MQNLPLKLDISMNLTPAFTSSGRNTFAETKKEKKYFKNGVAYSQMLNDVSH